MSFLRYAPSVCVIGNEYEIIVNAKENGLLSVQIAGETFEEENAGCLYTQKTIAKISVPQKLLDREKSYEIVYRKTIDKVAYFSVFGDEERVRFAFKPLEKTEKIHAYHIADVHYNFDIAVKAANFFGDDLDLFIVNGDIGEVETEENYFEVAKFVGDITNGGLPVLFVRGNHDTRGKLAEKYGDYFPVNGKDTYFTFEVGALAGVAYDCGEDKVDAYIHTDGRPVYNGSNNFEKFRRRETEWLKNITLPEGKIPFAVGHIPPVHTTSHVGDVFDIERELYAEWDNEFDRLGIKFMLCGHMHRAYVLFDGDERNTLPHDYPVIVGSACFFGETPPKIWGTALTIDRGGVLVQFTDQNKKVREEYVIKY
jgi:Icc-related predicted phosphoesterase